MHLLNTSISAFGLHILATDFDQDSWGKTPEEQLGQILIQFGQSKYALLLWLVSDKLGSKVAMQC